MAMVGDCDVSQYEYVALLTFLVFLFLVIIVLFNVLIAIVSETYMDGGGGCAEAESAGDHRRGGFD